jgi:hypothetical protein
VVLLNVGQRSLAIGYLVPFCFFLSMCLFAYARIVIRRPGSPNKVCLDFHGDDVHTQSLIFNLSWGRINSDQKGQSHYLAELVPV